MKNSKKSHVKLRDRIQYSFDKIMTKGTVSLIGILFCITVTVILCTAIILTIFSNNRISIFSGIWLALMHAIDTGTLTADNHHILYMTLMTIVTICGIFITSGLISILNTAFMQKLSNLQKGRSKVIESNHVVLLGFSDNIKVIIKELIIGNTSYRSKIVVLGNETKEKMEETIFSVIPMKSRRRIICRTGMISVPDDIALCSVETARAVIIDEDDDSVTIKSLICIQSVLGKNRETPHPNIIATIKNQYNIKPAETACPSAEILYFRNTVSRIMAHSCRQNGIYSVLKELFSFEGNEVYITPLPQYFGKPLREIAFFYPDATLIGYSLNKDHSSTATLYINPDYEKELPENAECLFLASSRKNITEGTTVPADSANIFPKSLSSNTSLPKDNNNTLIIGYNQMLEGFLEESSHYSNQAAYTIISQKNIALSPEIINPDQINVERKNTDIYSCEKWEKFIPEKISNILILSDYDCPEEEADAKVILLLLRLQTLNRPSLSITAEIRKPGNREIAELSHKAESSHHSEFIISSQLISMIVVQIAFQKKLRNFFTEILDEQGSEVYIKPFSYYIKGTAATVSDFTVAAMNRGETFIGFIRNGEITLNPPKGSEERIEMTPDDRIIVIAPN